MKHSGCNKKPKRFSQHVITKLSCGEFCSVPREVGGGWGCAHNEELDDAAEKGKGGMHGVES